jgi:hypothetical protein
LNVGLLWRVEWDPEPDPERCRLQGVFAAFAGLGVAAQPVLYSDETADAVRERLLGLDGVLVWVNPIEQGRDRSRLDALLREAAAGGVWVSAHPDVIAKLATKRVLVDTSELSWSGDVAIYRTAAELREQLPARLAAGPRVLKQTYGMGGHGVWKVELDGGPPGDPQLRVEHAADGAVEQLRLSALAARVGGPLVDQPFQERIAEGMIRVYLTHDEVVGFAHQYPKGLRPQAAGPPPPGKVFEVPTAPAFARLRTQMETEWLPELQGILGLDTRELPVIWDADFIRGARTAAGDDTYVLCEINASSTFAFPEHAMPTVARTAVARIAERSARA